MCHVAKFKWPRGSKCGDTLIKAELPSPPLFSKRTEMLPVLTIRDAKWTELQTQKIVALWILFPKAKKPRLRPNRQASAAAWRCRSHPPSNSAPEKRRKALRKANY